MDVRREVEELIVVLHMDELVRSLHNVANAFMPRVEVFRVTTEEALHVFRDAAVDAFMDEEMKMIRHQRERGDVHL